MAIDSRKQEIFEAWYEYDHSADEDSKISAKVRRNSLVQQLLDANGVTSDVTHFLRCFHEDYRQWQIGEGLKKVARRRF